MPKLNFSVSSIDAVRLPVDCEKSIFTDKRYPGLQLMVRWLPGVSRSKVSSYSDFHRQWYVRYSIGFEAPPKRSQVKIGDYPEMSPVNAAIKCEEIVRLGNSGQDPRAIVFKDRVKAVEQGTNLASLSTVPRYRVETVIDEWVGSWAKTNNKKSTQEKYRRDLELHFLTRHRGVDIRSITGKDWDDLVLTIANKEGKPGAANNLHKAGRALFSFCVREEILKYNPALQRRNVLESIRLSEDQRFFESHEVHKFITELWDQPISEWAKYNFELMLRVGVRVEEWERVKIGWIKYQSKRIEHPASSMKGGEEAWTYLPNQAIELLAAWLRKYKEAHGPLDPDWYLFPGNNPSEMRKVRLSDETKKIKSWMNFVPKMIRKTISTHLQRQGAPSAVGRVIRNQSLAQGVERNYDFDKLYHLKRDWIERWNELLEKVKVDPKALLTDSDIDLDPDLSSEFDDIFS